MESIVEKILNYAPTILKYTPVFSVIVTIILAIFVYRTNRQIEKSRNENAREIEKIRSSLNAWLSVQSIRIKKEFEAMEDIWNNLLETYDVLESAYVTARDSGKSTEEQMKKITAQYVEYNKVVNKNSPFLPQDILSFVHPKNHLEIIRTSFSSAIQSLNHEKTTATIHLDKEYMDEFGAYVDKVCEQIRSRMKSYDELMKKVS